MMKAQCLTKRGGFNFFIVESVYNFDGNIYLSPKTCKPSCIIPLIECKINNKNLIKIQNYLGIDLVS